MEDEFTDLLEIGEDYNIETNDEFIIINETKDVIFNDLYVDIFNIILIHYRNLFNKSIQVNMFDDIINEEDTNRCLELFYEFLYKYNNAKHDKYAYTLIYEVENYDEVKFFDELYSLVIKDKNIYKL